MNRLVGLLWGLYYPWWWQIFSWSILRARPLNPVPLTLIFGLDDLSKFVEHLNGQSGHIPFTMKLEDSNPIPFLDVLISRKLDDCLIHQGYCKKTHRVMLSC
jgi:hypothetical protein